jgi:hypothetical protein
MLRIIRNPQVQTSASLTGKVDGTYSYLMAFKGLKQNVISARYFFVLSQFDGLQPIYTKHDGIKKQ